MPSAQGGRVIDPIWRMFAIDGAGRPFVFLDAYHLWALAATAALCLLCAFVGRRAGPRMRAVFRYALPVVLILNEIVTILALYLPFAAGDARVARRVETKGLIGLPD